MLFCHSPSWLQEFGYIVPDQVDLKLPRRRSTLSAASPSTSREGATAKSAASPAFARPNQREQANASIMSETARYPDRPQSSGRTRRASSPGTSGRGHNESTPNQRLSSAAVIAEGSTEPEHVTPSLQQRARGGRSRNSVPTSAVKVSLQHNCFGALCGQPIR